MSLSRGQAALSWVLQLVVAAILLQTLYFKFTGAEESVYIFTRVGMEPWGRIGSGVAELVAGVFLLVPSLALFGAILAAGIVSGAIVFHLTILGVDIMGDGGLLFYLAVVVLLGSLTIIALRRDQLQPLVARLRSEAR